jgi:hypothetical protein
VRHIAGHQIGQTTSLIAAADLDAGRSCALLDTGKLKGFTDNLGRFAQYLSFWIFKESKIGSPNLHARGRITGFLSYRAGCDSSNFTVLRVIEAESIAHELELAEAEVA